MCLPKRVLLRAQLQAIDGVAVYYMTRHSVTLPLCCTASRGPHGTVGCGSVNPPRPRADIIWWGLLIAQSRVSSTWPPSLSPDAFTYVGCWMTTITGRP